MANTTPVARVSAVEGQAFAKSKNGELRTLHVGDLIYEGDVLVTAAGSQVDLAAPDGHTFVLRESETLTVDAEVMASVPPDAMDSAIQLGGSDVNTVVKAINEGGSLDALLEETAAGDVGAGADGGPTFVRLLRITEGVDPLGFEFETAGRSVVDDPLAGAGVQGAEGLSVTPENDNFSDANETLTVAEDSGATTGTLLSGTSSADGAVTVTQFEVGGTTYTIPAGGNATATLAAGTLVIGADGAYSFTPTANWNGTVPQVSYTLSDGSGANDTSTLDITVTPENDLPVSAGGAVTGTEDTPYVFNWADFNITDIDGGLSSGLLITNLPAAGDGVLERYDGADWIAVTAGQTIAQAEIESSRLRFVPAHNESGIDAFGGSGVGNRQSDYFSFEYQPTDGSSEDGVGAASIMRVDITPVADAPTLTISVGTPILTPEHVYLSVAGGVGGGGFEVVDRIVTGVATTNKLWNLSEYVAKGGNANGENTVGDIFVVGDTTGEITQAWRNQVQAFDGGGTQQNHPNDYIYLAGNASDYDISYTEQHINGVFSGYDGVTIRDRSTNVSTQTSNNIEDIIFGDGSTMSGTTPVIRTVTSAYNTYALNLSAALTDLDSSEVLSNITLTGIPNGVTLNHGTKQADGSWLLSSAQLSGLTMTVPSSISSVIDIIASVTSTETANGDTATESATLHIDPVPTLAVSSPTVLESEGYALFVVSLSNPSATNTVLTLSLANGTASGSGVDFGSNAPGNLQVSTDGGRSWSNSTTATIAAGAVSVLVRTPVVNDAVNEANETFTLTVTRSSGSTNNASVVGTATIDDNDAAAPSLLVTNRTFSLRENFSGLTTSAATTVSASSLRNDGAYSTGSWRTDSSSGIEVGQASHYGVGNASSYVMEIESWNSGEANNLYTTIATKAGEIYTVQFDAALRGDSNASGSLMYVYFGNQLVGTVNTSSSQMSSYSFTFVADTTGSSVLEFRAGDSNSYGVMMDNINVSLRTNTGYAGYQINLPSIAVSASTIDSTETVSVSVGGIPAGYSLTDGDPLHVFNNDTAAVATATVTGWDLTNMVLIPASGSSGTVTLTATATVADGSVTSSTTRSIVLTVLPDSGNLIGGAGDDNLTGTTNADTLWGFQGNDVLSGGNGNDAIVGGAGDDRIDGGAGNDILSGGVGKDTITGGTGSDYMAGGAGDDTLSGGTGNTADVFVWSLEDAGAFGSPARDTITDFGTGNRASGGDVLDLRDLLQGENHPTGTGNLVNYLHFQRSGSDTIVHISSTGAFASDSHVVGAVVASHEDQVIVLQGVDLVGNNTLDQNIITNLLSNGKLIVD